MKLLHSQLARALFVPLAVVTLASHHVLAQQPPVATPVAPAPAASQQFPQQDLDQLLAPIALYPDALVAQVLMASAFPPQVVEAARWSRAKGYSLTGTLLQGRWLGGVLLRAVYQHFIIAEIGRTWFWRDTEFDPLRDKDAYLFAAGVRF